VIRTIPLLLALAFMAAFVAGTVPTVAALAFEPGQRWSCVTDQGADAFMQVHAIEGESVSFSWGVIDSDTNALDRLCNKRERLSVEEMSDFCRLLGEEFSEGHVMLQKGCAAETEQQ